MKKKIIASLLTACLAAAMIPATVFAKDAKLDPIVTETLRAPASRYATNVSVNVTGIPEDGELSGNSADYLAVKGSIHDIYNQYYIGLCAKEGFTIDSVDSNRGHLWGYGPYTIWSLCNVTDVTVNMTHTCVDGEEPEVVEPTCTEPGLLTYRCIYCHGTTRTETIDPLGHDWGEPTFNWSDDLESCEATFVCNRDASHVTTLPCDVTSEITKEPTTEETGIKTYTATVTFEEKTYTDQKEKELDKLPKEDPKDPEDPEDPSKPSDPTDPSKPADPSKPGQGNNGNAGNKTNTAANANAKAKSTTPKTGDENSVYQWILLMALAGAAVTGTVVYSRKRRA